MPILEEDSKVVQEAEKSPEKTLEEIVKEDNTLIAEKAPSNIGLDDLLDQKVQNIDN